MGYKLCGGGEGLLDGMEERGKGDPNGDIYGRGGCPDVERGAPAVKWVWNPTWKRRLLVEMEALMWSK